MRHRTDDAGRELRQGDGAALVVYALQRTVPHTVCVRSYRVRKKILIPVLAACIGLAGQVSAAGLFSATGPVIAILAGELFVGEAEGHLSGAGTLAIHSQKRPELKCLGKFTSSEELGGKGELQCTDGATAKFQFKRLSVKRGHGIGSFNGGSMSFAYGLTAEEAAPYLKLPKGKKLVHNGTELELVSLPGVPSKI